MIVFDYKERIHSTLLKSEILNKESDKTICNNIVVLITLLQCSVSLGRNKMLHGELFGLVTEEATGNAGDTSILGEQTVLAHTGRSVHLL